MKRAVLNGESPNVVAKSILKDDTEVSTQLSEHMQKYRKNNY